MLGPVNVTFWSKDPYNLNMGVFLIECENLLYFLSKVYKVNFWDKIDGMKLMKWNWWNEIEKIKQNWLNKIDLIKLIW